MLGRAAAWGIAACLVAWPAACGIEPALFADANSPAAGAVIEPPHQTNDAFGARGQREAGQQSEAHIENSSAGEEQAATPAEPQPAAPLPSEPFGLAALPLASGDVVTKWSGVEADIRREHEILARCRDSADSCPRAAQSFLAIIAEGRAETGRRRIGIINRAINLAIHPMSDLAQWGVPDRWSAPLETFGTGRGDCEDYAIAKYVALTEAGVAAQDVRLVIVRNLAAGEDHAITAMHLDDNWIILDNRWLTLVNDADMDRVTPLFVLDEAGARQFVPMAMSARHLAAPASVGR